MIIVPTEKRFDWAHTPIVLIVIVLLNIAIYLVYQSHDNQKYESAFGEYVDEGYLAHEWPIYQAYIDEQKQQSPEQAQILNKTLAELQAYQKDGDTASLSYSLLREKKFSEYLQTNFANKYSTNATKVDFNVYQRLKEEGLYTKKWLASREKSRTELLSTSSLSLGLIPNRTSIVTLFSHQFLHGGTMHLIGNLFFLVICGFAVEAAIGHIRFLVFYLLSGLGGGLLHILLNLNSDVPLVGASGAISGVMAMYLAIFKFKKIEFFYWFFVFVGYFRAPALFILPFYIGSEAYNYFTNPHSSTAFMAHIGGFIIGAIAITITQRYVPMAINDEYIEEDQSLPASQSSLAKIYSAIENYQFQRAKSLIDEHNKEFGNSQECDLLKFNLCVKTDVKSAVTQALKLFKTKDLERRHLHNIRSIIRQYPVLLNNLNGGNLAALATQFVHANISQPQLKLPERLFEQALDKINKSKHVENKHNASQDLSAPHQLAILATKLASAFEQLNNQKKHQYYRDYADQNH